MGGCRMRTNKKKVVFFTRTLRIYAYISFFMACVVSGFFAIFNFNENIKFYYYSFYTIYNLFFLVLILIRIPYYRNEKRSSSNS